MSHLKIRQARPAISVASLLPIANARAPPPCYRILATDKLLAPALDRRVSDAHLWNPLDGASPGKAALASLLWQIG